MVSREVKAALVILAIATLPVTWLLVRWGMSLGVPLEALWKKIPNLPNGVLGWVGVVAFFGGVVFICLGLWGLINRDSEKQWHYSFAWICGGVIATGPVLGIMFQNNGLNPIRWFADPLVFIPIVILIAFATACLLAYHAARDPYWHPRRRRRHLTLRR